MNRDDMARDAAFDQFFEPLVVRDDTLKEVFNAAFNAGWAAARADLHEQVRELTAEIPTYGITSDHEAGYYDGRQSAYENVLERLA